MWQLEEAEAVEVEAPERNRRPEALEAEVPQRTMVLGQQWMPKQWRPKSPRPEAVEAEVPVLGAAHTGGLGAAHTGGRPLRTPRAEIPGSTDEEAEFLSVLPIEPQPPRLCTQRTTCYILPRRAKTPA